MTDMARRRGAGTIGLALTLTAPAAADAPSVPARDEPQTQARGEPQCTVKLELTKVKTRPGCFVDTPKRGSTGKATFRCRGGETHVVLGRHTFDGTVEGGELEALATSEFEFSDGCVWKTRQEVSGRLTDGELAYHYTERVVSSDGSCASPCTASGTVAVAD